MSLFLSDDEIEQLSGRKQAAAQRRVLDDLGIHHKTNAAGALLVSRRHVEQVFSGESSPARERKRPNIGALAG